MWVGVHAPSDRPLGQALHRGTLGPTESPRSGQKCASHCRGSVARGALLASVARRVSAPMRRVVDRPGRLSAIAHFGPQRVRAMSQNVRRRVAGRWYEVPCWLPWHAACRHMRTVVGHSGRLSATDRVGQQRVRVAGQNVRRRLAGRWHPTVCRSPWHASWPHWHARMPRVIRRSPVGS